MSYKNLRGRVDSVSRQNNVVSFYKQKIFFFLHIQVTWTIPPSKKIEYESIFRAHDTIHKGFLEGKKKKLKIP
jgi:hypothetical protein